MKPLLLLLVVACKDDTGEDSNAVNLGPELTHLGVDGAVYEGDALSIDIDAVDVDGVEQVLLYHRPQGDTYWDVAEMAPAEEGGQTWSYALGEALVQSPGLEYYFKATDTLGAVSYLPEDLVNDPPFSVDVGFVGEPLPFFEDFEITEGDSDLFDIGWAAYSEGFIGASWRLTSTRVYEGLVSVFHQRGDGDNGEIVDWLLSPAIDLSGGGRVQVSWREYGSNTAAANHSLWLSEGERSPEDGDYVEITTLAAPAAEAEWVRSAVIDLSEFTGSPTAYLAWRYEGSASDDWYVDAVTVRSLTIDPTLDLSWSPEVAHPGETVDLEVTITNLTEAAADSLTLSIELPEGAGTVDQETQDLGGIDALGTASVTFELSIDEAWPDNSYMPLSFELSDGEDTWTFDRTFIVGYLSEGRLDLEMLEAGVVQVSLGLGDPDAPEWERDVYAANVNAGPVEITVDLTDDYADLPPEPGPGRWFARIQSAALGSVELFEIDYSGVTYAGAGLPLVLPDEDAFAYVPQPPDPTLASVSASTSPLSPGLSAQTLNLSVRNDGAETSGPVSLTLSSADGDVLIVDGGPVALGSGSLGAGASESLLGAFSFDVSSAHVDSTDVSFTLTADDGLEQWEMPFDLAVPWPVMRVTGVAIDDSVGGDGDGILEPGEGATLEIEVTNVGDLNAFSVVRGTLSLASSSTAAASVGADEQIFGLMNVDQSRDEDFTIEVDAGANLGDVLDLVVMLSDGTATYEAPAQIVLGEAPWILVSSLDDDVGDNNGYTFDLKNVYYRSDGTTFELRLESHQVFNTTTAFAEMWALPTASYYSYFRLVLQSGVARLQGYRNGFITLMDPDVAFIDETNVVISWPVEVMESTSNSMRSGFGAGWCGNQTGSYCDHFPDGWGYYYSGYTSSNFFTLRW
ncbi:MAG: choice-of-anchor J domain-containing protein [Alphaproteobacteria bacterium]|nr:choice-of-anchor J domain-containing protein [Alphaproteobacteria bacterium]MCB9793904.1 choice-of-anchor J domain-containing protein [Alphaproteobacteria bacterium]